MTPAPSETSASGLPSGISDEDLDKICHARAAERGLINEPDIQLLLHRLSRALSTLSKSMTGEEGSGSVEIPINEVIPSGEPPSKPTESETDSLMGPEGNGETPPATSSSSENEIEVNRRIESESESNSSEDDDDDRSSDNRVKLSKGKKTVKSGEGNASLQKFGAALAEAATHLGSLLRSAIVPATAATGNRELENNELTESDNDDEEESSSGSSSSTNNNSNEGLDDEEEDEENENSKLLL